MDIELTLLAVPALAVLVLGVLLVTAGRTMRNACLGTLGLVGVLFGGPGTMFVLGAPPTERAVKTRDVVPSNLAFADSSLAGELPSFTAPSDPEAEGSGSTLTFVECAADATETDGEIDLSGVTKPSGSADESDKVAPKSGATTNDESSPSSSASKDDLHEPIASHRVTYEGRPDWATMARERHGKAIDREVVSSGPYSRVQDCAEGLDEELQKAIDAYIDWQLKRDNAHQFVSVDLGYIHDHLVKERARYQVNSSVGEMQQSDALVEFDQSFRDLVKHRWDDARAKSRLLLAGLFGGGAIGVLALLFSFFRLDNATRGFYSGRLQFATVAAILGLVAAGVLLARWIPWL